MNTAYFKLKAKKQLVNNHFKCFCISLLPYVAIILLVGLNYYFYILLKGTSFEFLPPDSIYAPYFLPTLLALSITLSLVTVLAVWLFSQSYFYRKSSDENATYIEAVRAIKPKKIFVIGLTLILKFLLSVAWSAFFLLPSMATGLALFYYINSDEQQRELSLTISICAIVLLAIGLSCLFVVLKRYSLCNEIIFFTDEKNPIKVIEKSIELMEGKSVTFALYSLSFLGWILSCILIVPIFYVLPYRLMARHCFFNGLIKQRTIKRKEEKPIIFYISKPVST